MDSTTPETVEETHGERMTRVRVGATGLAVIVIVVLLAASFSGTASNEPELTPEAMAEDAATSTAEELAEEQQPQEPLAELGVAPTTGPTEEAGDAAAADDLPEE